jgi:hypothetical protein
MALFHVLKSVSKEDTNLKKHVIRNIFLLEKNSV